MNICTMVSLEYNGYTCTRCNTMNDLSKFNHFQKSYYVFKFSSPWSLHENELASKALEVKARKS